MPHASVVRTRSGMTLAIVAVILGGLFATVFIAGWLYTIIALHTFSSPGIATLLMVFAVSYGASRLTAERRVDVLATQFPQAFVLHLVMTAGQRKRFLAFAEDARIDAKIPFLGGRFALVATAEWVRIYRGVGNPTVVIEVPIGRVAGVSFETKKSFLATQSLLTFELTGPTRAWPADASAVYFRTITPAAIPEQFYSEELAAMKAVTHSSGR